MSGHRLGIPCAKPGKTGLLSGFEKGEAFPIDATFAGAASYLVILQCELRLGYSPAQAGAALIPPLKILVPRYPS